MSKSIMSNPPNENDRPDVEEGLADPRPSSTPGVSPSFHVVYPLSFARRAPPAPAEAAAEQRFGPHPPTDTIEAISDAVGGGIASASEDRGNFEQVDEEDDDAPPAPFNSAEFDEDNAEKWAATPRARSQIESTDDDEAPPASFNSMGIILPPMEEIRNESVQVPTSQTSNRVPLFLADGGGGGHGIDTYSRPRQAVGSRAHLVGDDAHASGEDNEDLPDYLLRMDTNGVRTDFERDSTIVVPEAILVRDEEIYIATQVDPIEPWWKQRRMRFFISAPALIVIALSIALGLKMDGNTEDVVLNSPAPSFSMAPSTLEDLTTVAPAFPSATCSMDPNCGATLDTWTGISGGSIADLMNGTNNFKITPSKSERLGERPGQLLEVTTNTDDLYGSRIKGWLIPPVTGDYVFWIVADDSGELWLSSDDHRENKVRVCFVQAWVGYVEWTKFPEQESTSIPLVAGEAYFFEVRPCIFLSVSIFLCFMFSKTHPLLF
jgi:hypothetical protein